MNQNNLSKNNKSRLILGIHLIDAFIGSIVTLICVLTYISVENIYVRYGIIIFLIIAEIVSIILIYMDFNRKDVIVNESSISRVELVNEENEIIREWDLNGQISVIIGKSTKEENVFIDLNKSIYSPLIDNNHALLNYAGGKWYIEDISQEQGIAIQRADEDIRYRIVKGSPCTVKKGDIIYISKVKLLLN